MSGQERGFVPENVSDEELIRIVLTLKETLPDEVKRVFFDWREKEEKKIPNGSLHWIEFNRRCARVYAAAGYIEEAKDALQGALDTAWNEHRDELHAEIKEELKRLGSV